jgi:transposase
MADNMLGIDVAKGKFDVVLMRADGKRRWRTFANTAEGFGALLEWLEKQQALPVHACMEATGTYGLALATFLHQADQPVSVVNPACINAFSESELSRTKTDKVDAGLIARFCVAMRPALWQPPAPEVAKLQGLVRRLESVQEMAVQERNRLAAPGLAESVRESVERTLAMLEEEMKRLRSQLDDHVEGHPALKQQRELLTSINGVGKKTANLLLAELSGCDFQKARQVAAYAGLVPQERRSGSSVRGKARLSKKGNGRLRKALYWPAIVAIRHNPMLAAFARRLREAGKPKMVVIAAVMRKLLHIAFGVLKHQRPFDPNWTACRT